MAEKKKQVKKPVNAVSSRTAEQKRMRFAEAYLSNGENATQAAISAGYAAHSAAQTGNKLLRNAQVSALIASRRLEIIAGLELNTDRLVKEVSRLAFSDPRRIMHEDGRIKLPHELDDDTAAAIASFKFDVDGNIEYKFWDKNSAQERAAKIVGVFEKDNKQRNDPLHELIGALSGKVLGVAKADDEDE